jgi:uncharacterized protein (TIGR02444 family)
MQTREKQRCREMSSAFWLFSQSVYTAAGVQEECLLLQDRFGIDINLLLFSAFVGAVHGALLPTEELSNANAAVAQWQEGIVRSLRTVRRALKQAKPPHPIVAAPIHDLREKIKSIELEAERIEQVALEAWCQSRVESWPRAERATAVTANVRALFALSGDRARKIALPANTIAAVQTAARVATLDRKTET